MSYQKTVVGDEATLVIQGGIHGADDKQSKRDAQLIATLLIQRLPECTVDLVTKRLLAAKSRTFDPVDPIQKAFREINSVL